MEMLPYSDMKTDEVLGGSMVPGAMSSSFIFADMRNDE